MNDTNTTHAGAPIVSEFANDADMIEIVELFISELPVRVAAMSDALRTRDFKTLTHLAHQLKGAAGGYGFPAITDAAANLERIGIQGDRLPLLAAEVEKIVDMCARARATPTEG